MIITEMYIVCDGCGRKVLSGTYPPRWPVLKVETTELHYHSRECLTNSITGRSTASNGYPNGLPNDVTPRDITIIKLIATGMSNAMIGQHIHLAASTVKNLIISLMRKLDAHDRTNLVVRAHVLGLIKLGDLVDVTDLA